MALLDKVPITNLEKWITRIIAAALAVWEVVKKLIETFSNQ